MLKLSRTFFPFLTMLAISPAVHANSWIDPRGCELPHQMLEARCGNPEALSAVQKKKGAKDLLADYQRRSSESTGIVTKANEEYRAYFSRKK
jgi:hypothetical protein